MKTAEVVVIGAGLAGGCVVRGLLAAGVREIAWLDPLAPGTSCPPVALVHPFAGRSFQPRAGIAAAWAASRVWARSLGEGAGLFQAPLRRYPTDADRGRLLASLTKHGPALRRLYGDDAPRTAGREGAEIVYTAAFSLDLARAVRAMRAQAASRGVVVVPSAARRIVALDRGWAVHAEDDVWRAPHAVVAAGLGSPDVLGDRVEAGRFEVVDGALLHAVAAPMEAFVISAGHACSTTERVGWGSSFAVRGAAAPTRHEEQLRAVDRRLRARIEMPALASAKRWHGARLVDRRSRTPWVATLAPGLFACTAFGSQGGLLAPAAAADLVDRITGGPALCV